ncbi:hypothetical protein D3C85_1204980 [compost metagenome]
MPQMRRVVCAEEPAQQGAELRFGHAVPVRLARKGFPRRPGLVFFMRRGSGVRRQRAIALAMRGGVAQPRAQVQGGAEIQADIALVGIADGAVQLDGEPRRFDAGAGGAGLDPAGRGLALLDVAGSGGDGIQRIQQAVGRQLDLHGGVHQSVLQGLE